MATLCAAQSTTLQPAPATCQTLRETLTHPRWLCLPMSRLVVNPTYTYSPSSPASFAGDAVSTDLAYYVGAAPARLPAFLAWQLSTPHTALVGQSVDFTQADWQTGEVTANFADGQVRFASTGPFGSLSRQVTVDLDRTPGLLVQVPVVAGQWALKVNDGTSTTLISDTGMSGEYLSDIPTRTGWHGTKTFTLELWAVGGPQRPVTVSKLQFLSLGSMLGPRSYSWQPHQIITHATSSNGNQTIEVTTSFPNAATVAQRLRILQAGASHLRLTGRFLSGTIVWDKAHQSLLLQGVNYHAVLAFSRPAHWLGIRATALDWLSDNAKTNTNLKAGVWGLEWDGLKTGDQIVVAARFTPTPKDTNETRLAAQSIATPTAFAAAVQQQEAMWNQRLARVPHPLDFTPRAVAASDITAAEARRSYYRAWVFFYANTLPPMPENGFPYPQVCAGKPSLWTDGAPHSEETATWDGGSAMQALALVDPPTAWLAAQGIMSQVDPTGYLGGECLPPIFAQTFWLLYEQTGDLARLRAVYPALKRYLEWKINNPRWVYPNKAITDVKPSTMKDNEFVVHELIDMGYALRIAAALGLKDEVAFWQQQQGQQATNYQAWFWPAPGHVVYRIYVSDTDRANPDNVWNLKGLQLGPTLLSPQSRDAMIALYHQKRNLELPFLITQNRFPDLEPITLGLFQYGQVADAAQLTDAILRDVTWAGDFSEDYTPVNPPVPAGVRPSAFGARLMTDSVFWHNGVVLDEGLPVLLGMPGPAGVDNIPVHGSPISVRFDQATHGVTIQGPGLARLRLPGGFKATKTADGITRWQGKIKPGAQIKLEKR